MKVICMKKFFIVVCFLFVSVVSVAEILPDTFFGYKIGDVTSLESIDSTLRANGILPDKIEKDELHGTITIRDYEYLGYSWNLVLFELSDIDNKLEHVDFILTTTKRSESRKRFYSLQTKFKKEIKGLPNVIGKQSLRYIGENGIEMGIVFPQFFSISSWPEYQVFLYYKKSKPRDSRLEE